MRTKLLGLALVTSILGFGSAALAGDYNMLTYQNTVMPFYTGVFVNPSTPNTQPNGGLSAGQSLTYPVINFAILQYVDNANSAIVQAAADGSDSLGSYVSSQVFLAKLNSDGTFVSRKPITSAGANVNAPAGSILVQAHSSVVNVGVDAGYQLQDWLWFNTSTGTMTFWQVTNNSTTSESLLISGTRQVDTGYVPRAFVTGRDSTEKFVFFTNASRQVRGWKLGGGGANYFAGTPITGNITNGSTNLVLAANEQIIGGFARQRSASATPAPAAETKGAFFATQTTTNGLLKYYRLQETSYFNLSTSASFTGKNWTGPMNVVDGLNKSNP